MKLNKDKNIFYSKTFWVLLYICIGINTKVVVGNVLFGANGRTINPKRLAQIKPTSNGRRFDVAKEAMNLITTVDLPTCRCVNFAAGTQQCEVQIPSQHLRILNINCQRLLRCNNPSAGSTFGVCCQHRKIFKSHVTPNDLSQLFTTLRRLGSQRGQHQQCSTHLITNSGQVPISNPKIYVTPAVKTATTTKKSLPNITEKSTILKNILIEKDQLDQAAIRLATDVMGPNPNLHPNSFQLEATTTSNHIVITEKVVQEDTCNCVPSGNCSIEQISYTFGTSCKIGNVRCCSPPRTTTTTEEITTVSSTTPISTATPNYEGTTTTASTFVATSLHPENSTPGKAIIKPNATILNHRLSGHTPQSLQDHYRNLNGYESSPYQRYSIPTKSSYIYRSPMRRPPQFYEQLNNIARNISQAERPRYHPNDGRFHTFSTKDQKAQNRKLELIENDEVIDNVPKLAPAVASTPRREYTTKENIKSFKNNNNQFRQQPIYLNNNGQIVDIRRFNEYQQRKLQNQMQINQQLQNPSLLQRFQNFLVGTGQVLTQALG